MRRSIRAGLTSLAVIVGAIVAGIGDRDRISAQEQGGARPAGAGPGARGDDGGDENGGDSAEPGPSAPSPRDPAATPGNSAAGPSPQPVPDARPARTIVTWHPPIEDIPSALLIGAGSRAAETLGALQDDAVERSTPEGPDLRAVLLVAREESLRPATDFVREFVRGGGVAFVDAWGGDEAWLASLADGGIARALTPEDAVLAAPHALGSLPPSHQEPDARIVGVVASGEVRVIATRQDTLCHACACERAGGRMQFGQNLAHHAAGVAKRSRAAAAKPANSESPFEFGNATLAGRRLRASVTVRNDTAHDAVAWLRLVPREGAVVAEASRPVPAKSAVTVELDVELPAPFDVVEHRLVASRETGETVLRTVAPLEAHAGAPDLVVWHTGSVVPGMPAAVRAIVRNSRTFEPMGAGTVSFSLSGPHGPAVGNARGALDSAGTAALAVPIPPDANGTLAWQVAADTLLGTESARTATTAKAPVSGHLFVDVPVHRPGSVLRFRVLAVRRPSNAAVACAAVDVTLSGPVAPKAPGSTIATATLTTGVRGVAIGELVIPDTASTGDYVLRAGGLAEGTVRIEAFEIPRFRVAFDPAPRSIRKGGRVEGALVASRFDGSPIAGAVVSLVVGPAELGAVPFARWEGLTDTGGRAEFRVRCDATGRSGEDVGALRLDASVRDAGGRSVAESVTLLDEGATSSAVRVVGASGGLLAGRKGTVLVRTERAPGTDVAVRVDGGAPQRLVVDDLGFVEAVVEASAAPVRVDVDGHAAEQARSVHKVALRPGRRVIPEGSRIPLRVEALGTDEAVFVDVTALGSLLATHRLRVVEGVAAAELELPEGLTGPVTLQAYLRPTDFRMEVSAATVFVVPKETLRVSVSPSSADVRPGDPVELSVRVTDPAGRGVPSAFALRVVDEAVLSLVEHPMDAAHVTLAMSRALASVRDGDRGTLFSVLAAAAAQRPLSRGEARLAEAMLASRDAPTHYAATARSLPDRRASHIERVRKQWTSFAPVLLTRFEEVLTGPRSPVPSPECPDFVAAIRAAAKRGAFGPDGLLDPWGNPLEFGPAPAFPPEYDVVEQAEWDEDETAEPFPGSGGFSVASPGPDGERARSTARRATAFLEDDTVPADLDDAAWEFGHEDALELHAAWVRRHGRVFNTVGYLTHGRGKRTFGIGGGAGGKFGGRRGGSRNLSAGGGGRRSDIGGAGETPRARSFFPDAIVFAPLVLTDDAGHASLSLDTPDSVTTWRADAVAHTPAGGVGQGSATFRTTLPFSADPDVPPTLHTGDEVAIPVVLRWSEGERATVIADVAVSGPLHLLSPAKMALQPGALGEDALFVRVRANGPGMARVTIRCRSGAASDAIEREISVVAAGREVSESAAFLGRSGRAVPEVRRIDRAIPGTERLELRIRNGGLDDVLDGVAGLLRAPHGCFEQASSTTYPNILAMLALESSPAMTAALRQQFDRAIRDGTDLLLSYEIAGGGFDWFGRPPAKLLLSAYGAQEFWALHELRRMQGREPFSLTTGASAVAMRTMRWIVTKQREDGSFPAEGAPYEWRGQASGDIAATAYVGLALRQAARRAPAQEFHEALRRARSWVAARAEDCDDPYALALATYFLCESGSDSAAEGPARRLLAKLDRRDDAARVGGGRGSAFHSRGTVASVEATAFAALAAGRLPASDILPSDELLLGLARARRADGTWGTTQATVLALHAFIEQRECHMTPGTETVVRPEGAAERRAKAPATPGSVTVDLGDALALPGPRRVEVTRPDGGGVAGVLTLTCRIPWAPQGDVAGDVTVERTFPERVRVGERFLVPVRIRNRAGRPVAMPIVVVPLPPGVLVEEAVLRSQGLPEAVARIEADTERVTIYLRELPGSGAIDCVIPATARLRGRVAVAPAEARPYYEPDAMSRSGPAMIVVE